MNKNYLILVCCMAIANTTQCIVGQSWQPLGASGDMTGANLGDNAGTSVAISSDGLTIAMGEPGWLGGDTGTGRVRAYNLIGGSWIEIGNALDMTGENTGDNAGNSVAISSDGLTIAMGEPYWSGVTGPGRVRVYNFTGGSWTPIGGSDDMIGANPDDEAGYSVAISSDGLTVAMGEPGWNSDFGRVRVYNFTGGSWTAIGGDQDMTGTNLDDEAGWSVAISSDGLTIAMGEFGWNYDSGRVRVYNLTGGSWIEIGGDQDMTGENFGDQAGNSVAISSDGLTVAMGEPGWLGGDTGIGRVRVYNLMSGSWVEAGNALDMTGQNTSDNAGTSVAISSDGLTVAMGEPGWLGGDTGIGRVRVYNLIGDSWVKAGGVLNMTGQNPDDQAGTSVAISSDGLTVAMGEPGWLGGDTGIGRVRAFVLNLTQQEAPLLSYKPENLGGKYNVAGKIEDFNNTFYPNSVYPRLQ